MTTITDELAAALRDARSNLLRLYVADDVVIKPIDEALAKYEAAKAQKQSHGNCKVCHGRGRVASTDHKGAVCPYCNGSGGNRVAQEPSDLVKRLRRCAAYFHDLGREKHGAPYMDNFHFDCSKYCTEAADRIEALEAGTVEITDEMVEQYMKAYDRSELCMRSNKVRAALAAMRRVASLKP